MNDLGIKGGLIKDGATQGLGSRAGSVTALTSLAISFQELLNRTSTKVEDSLSALIDRTGFSSVAERPEAANHADDYGRDNADNGRNHIDNRDTSSNDTRSNDTDDGRSDGYHAEKYDDYGREHGADHSESGSDTYFDDDGAGQDGDDHTLNEDDGNNDTSTDQQASDSDNKDGEDDGGTAEADAENQADDGENSAQGNTVQTEETTNAVLAALTAVGKEFGENGKASMQGKDNSEAGIARATSNISNTGPEGAAAQATENMSQKAIDNALKTTPSSTRQDNHASQGQTESVANEGAAIVAGTDDKGASNIDAQVAGLAKAIGDGNRAQVTVSVNNESQNLISKPGQTLSANTLLSAGSSAQHTNSQNTNANTQGSSQNPAAQAQTQMAEAAQAQNQATQNAATQVTGAGAAKGLTQAASVSSGSAHASSAGGGEGTTQANSTQQTGSQSAAKQAANTQKSFRPGHSIAEQISVKITKAIQAGNDKITIQLRPANMGRIEVKMELSQDSRLTAIVTVDNRDTLEQLKNDSRSLQRALQEAGLQTDAGDLEFNMRGQEGQGQEAKGSPDKLSFDDQDLAALEAEITDQPLIATDGTIISDGRVDVRA